MADKIKLAIAFLLVVAGLSGYYVFADQATILRVLSVLGGVAAALAVAWFTVPGKQFYAFSRKRRRRLAGSVAVARNNPGHRRVAGSRVNGGFYGLWTRRCCSSSKVMGTGANHDDALVRSACAGL
jgi:hypothetical protein